MKTAINEMTMTFLSRSANESFARSAVASFFVQLDPTVEELADIKTALSEAVTNCIVHAYAHTLGKIRITAKIFEDSKISVQIRDNGCGIPDIPKAMEPMYTTSPNDERAGLGFAVMQSFMDKVNVRSSPGKGTTITLTKKLCSKDQHEPASE